MSVNPVSSSANNQYVSALTNDFTSLQNSLQSLVSAQKSGNSDTVTLSENALQKAMAQFQTDLANLSQRTQSSTQSASGHHHNHHHGSKVANATNSAVGNSTLASSGYNPGTFSQSNAGTLNLIA